MCKKLNIINKEISPESLRKISDKVRAEKLIEKETKETEDLINKINTQMLARASVGESNCHIFDLHINDSDKTHEEMILRASVPEKASLEYFKSKGYDIQLNPKRIVNGLYVNPVRVILSW